MQWGRLERGVRWLEEVEVRSAKTEVRDLKKKQSDINKSAKITRRLRYLKLSRS